ncbi:MAG: acylphosphatase [Thermoprotei archaeon]
MATTRVRALISGRVQGVGFRSWTRKKALQLGLKGWVRNLADGRVECVLEGENLTVKKMLALCWKGPMGSRVDDVETLFERPKGEASFRIL